MRPWGFEAFSDLKVVVVPVVAGDTAAVLCGIPRMALCLAPALALQLLRADTEESPTSTGRTAGRALQTGLHGPTSTQVPLPLAMYEPTKGADCCGLIHLSACPSEHSLRFERHLSGPHYSQRTAFPYRDSLSDRRRREPSGLGQNL